VPPRLTREKRQLGAHPALSLSLPDAKNPRRSIESPRDPPPIHPTPAEGAEPPPCRKCLSALGSVLRHCSSSHAAQALLFTFFHSFSLAQWRTFGASRVERLLEGHAEVRMAALHPPLPVPRCQARVASAVSLGTRKGGYHGATRREERLAEPPQTLTHPHWQCWQETYCVGQRAWQDGGSQLCHTHAAGAGWQLASGPFCCGAAL